jgi:hypothetical protein
MPLRMCRSGSWRGYILGCGSNCSGPMLTGKRRLVYLRMGVAVVAFVSVSVCAICYVVHSLIGRDWVVRFVVVD